MEYDTPEYLRFCADHGQPVGSAQSFREYAEHLESRDGLERYIADKLAAEFGNDGQIFEHPATGETLKAVCERHGARVEYARRGANFAETGDYYVSPWHGDHIDGDPIRFVFTDGSAIVEIGDGWDIEGPEPFR